MTTIYLIRHGEAEGNLYRRAQGHYNSNLTPLGFEQIEKLAERFSDIHVDKVYASDLTRAYLTAKIIADTKGLSVIKNKNLREIDMGIMEDRPWSDLPRLHPELDKMWHSEPDNCEIPNGESPIKATERFYNEVIKIAKENKDKSVVIGTHGAVIRYFLHVIKNVPLSDNEAVNWCHNTAITKITFDDDMNITLEYESDSSHIDDVISPFLNTPWWECNEILDLPNINLWFKPILNEQDEELGYNYAKECDDSISFINFKAMCEQLRAKNENLCCLVYSDDMLCGLVVFDIENEKCEIIYLVIEERLRGKGLTPPIFGHLLHVSRRNGAKVIVSDRKNKYIEGFLTKIGFDIKDDVMSYDATLYNED